MSNHCAGTLEASPAIAVQSCEMLRCGSDGISIARTRPNRGTSTLARCSIRGGAVQAACTSVSNETRDPRDTSAGSAEAGVAKDSLQSSRQGENMNRSRNTAFLIGAVLTIWGNQAGAFPTYYTNYCAACHGPTPTTCNGCHSHGTHTDSAHSDINVAGATDQSVYQVGDTVTVTITGGYRIGWIRGLLFDDNFNEIARVSSEYPLTLAVPAPSTPGDYNWSVTWYGNYQYEAEGASFGLGLSDLLWPDYFTPDPGNANHGFQTVAIPTFTVLP